MKSWEQYYKMTSIIAKVQNSVFGDQSEMEKRLDSKGRPGGRKLTERS